MLDLEAFAAAEASAMALSKTLEGASRGQLLMRRMGPKRWLKMLADLAPLDRMRLAYDFDLWARPKQRYRPNDDFERLLLLGGRGIGKNWFAANRVRRRIEQGKARSICFIAPDWKDARRNMLGEEGTPFGSGFFAALPPWIEYTWDKNKHEIRLHVLPTGHRATVYVNTGESKEQRGGNFDTLWLDELVKFRYLDEVMGNLELALRGADYDPCMFITTTPKPLNRLRELVADVGTVTIMGRTDENIANLGHKFVTRQRRMHAGTRLEMQELDGRILGDNPEAMFHMHHIEAARIRPDELPMLTDCVVGVDPAVSTKKYSDATGIVVMGKDAGDHLYVIGDQTGRYDPGQWAQAAVTCAIECGARAFVVETNKIGQLAKANLMTELRRQDIEGEFEICEAYSLASKGDRADPVAAMYARGEVHHVGNACTELESEITEWNPKRSPRSPNRLDALVHAAFELAKLGDTGDDKPAPLEDFSGLARLNAGFDLDYGETI